MQRVIFCKPVIEVESELIVSDGSDGRTSKRARPAVRCRYQGKQLFDHGIRHGRALRVRQHATIQCQCLPVFQTFVAEEEERPILHDGTTERAAVLIAPESRLCDVEKISRVEDIVPEVVEDFAVEFVGAGLGCNVDDRAGIAPVFGAERRVRNFEFIDGVYGRLKGDLMV